MPTEVVMPEIGETVVTGTIVTWLKEVGDEVGVDEPLVEVATDKANVEIPAPAAGILRKILAEEGDLRVLVDETYGMGRVIGYNTVSSYL